MKRVLSILSIGLLTSSLYGQQLAQYSQYLRNQYMINPAASGVYDFTDITVSGRWQWAGFDNTPKTAYASGSFTLGAKNRNTYNPGIRTSSSDSLTPEVTTGKLKHAFGGQVMMDEYGAFQKMNASATYAVHVPLTPVYNLSFGAKVGMTNNTFLQDRAIPVGSATDNTYQTYVGNQSNRFNLDIGAGLYLYSQKLFVGISADQLTGDLVEFGSGTPFYQRKIHYIFTGGYKIPVNANLTLTPAVLVKFMNPAPVSIEGTIQAEYKERFWGGVSYRHQDAIVGMLGMTINRKFKFGYSYDFALTRYNTYKAGGHELILGIMLGR